MKVFDLVCGDSHRFEGWFASSERFVEQSNTGTIRCPLCDSADVRREPSAPRLNFGSGSPMSAPRALADPASGATSTSASTAASNASSNAASNAMKAIDVLRRLVAGIENVGPRFAEEARRIHYEEVPARPIRGVATEAERRDLQDEGIETLELPIPRLSTGTLQ